MMTNEQIAERLDMHVDSVEAAMEVLKKKGFVNECGEVITPPKGEPMPKTIEHFIKRGDSDQELILNQKEEISALKVRNDRLESKLMKKRTECKDLASKLNGNGGVVNG